MDTLRDKVVLITGAGKGCGQILAEVFAERGACVAANDISPVNVEEVVKEITNKGGRAKTYVEDIAKKLGAQWIVNQVQDDFGPIDILINHAAVQPHVPLLEMDEWDWHRVLDVNLTGAFLMTQAAGRLMRERGKGVIISLVTDSIGGKSEAAFVASMAARKEFTNQAARELSQHGIHVFTAKNDPATIVDQVFSLLSVLEEQ